MALRLILVGAGGATRELLRRLGDMWDVTVVDARATELREAERIREVMTVEGDGSSRLVLERAGLVEADAVVASTSDDDANLEVCRLARAAGVLKVLAVAADPEHLAAYRRQGVQAVSPASLTARRLELTLETRRVSSTAFADGRAEAIEFRIASDSPARRRPLREIGAQGWLVAAVLREGRLLIPHGDTVLETGDQVTVVGSAQELPDILRAFTSGEPTFPLDFGKQVAVAVRGAEDIDGALVEAVYLTRTTPAASLLIAHEDPDARENDLEPEDGQRLRERMEEVAGELVLQLRPVPRRPERALTDLAGQESVGLVVLPAGLAATRAGARRLVNSALQLHRPILLSRGAGQYQRIVMPARRTIAGRAGARAAIDLAVSTRAPLVALAVAEPEFLAGPDATVGPTHDVGWSVEEAAVQGVEVQRELRQGNPVRAFRAVAGPQDLIVIGVDERPGLFGVRVAEHLARRAPCSVLLVPAGVDEERGTPLATGVGEQVRNPSPAGV